MAQKWNKPVTLALGEDGSFVTIDSAEAASWALIEDWPVEDGTALDRALVILAAVAEGKRVTGDPRQAFVEAAIEAGIAIKP